jgi:Ca2+-binding RTX toxin-like protein
VRVTALDGSLLCADCGTEGPGHSHDDAEHHHGDGEHEHSDTEHEHIDGITITGGPTNDTFAGTDGDDVMIGGLGADTLTGGAGNDRFVYRFATEGGDKILDFSITEDSLSFSASGFGAGLTPGMSLVAGINFIASENPAATTTASTFLFNTETHELSWDVDGSADGAAVLIADFDPPASLTTAHFEIAA